MNYQVPQLTSGEWFTYVSLNRFISVAELSALTGVSEAETTEHLATLREQGLIHQEDRDGTTVYRRTSESSVAASDRRGPAAPAEAVPGGAGRPPPHPDRASHPVRGRAFRAGIALLLVTLLALAGVLLLAAARQPDVSGVFQSDADRARTEALPGDTLPGDTGKRSPTPVPPEPPSRSPKVATELRLRSSSYSAEPFESVAIQGTYVGSAPGTALMVQRQQNGTWVSFPLPAVTGEGGSFSTRVELGPGRYRLRVADLESDVVSEAIVLRIG